VDGARSAGGYAHRLIDYLVTHGGRSGPVYPRRSTRLCGPTVGAAAVDGYGAFLLRASRCRPTGGASADS